MWPVKKKPVSSLSPSSHSELDLDPYSMSIVEELLNVDDESLCRKMQNGLIKMR
jgi:hypothetical protein